LRWINAFDLNSGVPDPNEEKTSEQYRRFWVLPVECRIYWVERKVFAFSKTWRKQKLYCNLFKTWWCLSCHYINYASNANYIID
jgi:hypothetical protein